MKSKDIFAFTLLYGVSIFLLLFVGYLWIDNIGWNYLWILGVIITLLVILLGYLFAKYAFSPLVEQNSELDNLLKDTLHELNIPVATIKANVAMLKKSCPHEKSQKRLERIAKASDQLLALYKEVDFFIKKEIDKDTRERFDVAEVVKDRVEFFKELLQKKRIYTDLQPLQVNLPKIGFIKSFDNILSNAIKYTPKDGLIKIIVKDAKLVIEDNGIGMSDADLLRVFDRYYRATDKNEGYGIGLNIVKRFCDEENIRISIDAKKGEGTKVTLDLAKVKV
ncbi:two-component system response regulator [Nitratiruptor sp. YY08-26]|uniref:sensor histidine kinase n=1 Tax=unclassified Nitratiruptor TaxID=2624044 RepID=UPI001914DC73|nr:MULTISPECIES: HAMP domain-containing sensor histidine kinase [unclassified Nitratiruptor]BCD61678.1 two-component system response regulator [Nitratiruptor sp. YY08-13]BCD65613.1 two-component system response regulator [Nitratiruptor sp. YY08-26]